MLTADTIGRGPLVRKTDTLTYTTRLASAQEQQTMRFGSPLAFGNKFKNIPVSHGLLPDREESINVMSIQERGENECKADSPRPFFRKTAVVPPYQSFFKR